MLPPNLVHSGFDGFVIPQQTARSTALCTPF